MSIRSIPQNNGEVKNKIYTNDYTDNKGSPSTDCILSKIAFNITRENVYNTVPETYTNMYSETTTKELANRRIVKNKILSKDITNKIIHEERESFLKEMEEIDKSDTKSINELNELPLSIDKKNEFFTKQKKQYFEQKTSTIQKAKEKIIQRFEKEIERKLILDSLQAVNQKPADARPAIRGKPVTAARTQIGNPVIPQNFLEDWVFVEAHSTKTQQTSTPLVNNKFKKKEKITEETRHINENNILLELERKRFTNIEEEPKVEQKKTPTAEENPDTQKLITQKLIARAQKIEFSETEIKLLNNLPISKDSKELLSFLKSMQFMIEWQIREVENQVEREVQGEVAQVNGWLLEDKNSKMQGSKEKPLSIEQVNGLRDQLENFPKVLEERKKQRTKELKEDLGLVMKSQEAPNTNGETIKECKS